MDFYSLYNITSNFTNRYKRHDNFVTDIKLPTCAMVQVVPYESRCKFVMETDECHESVFVFDYMNLMYCTFAPKQTVMIVLCVFFLLFIIANLFYILGTTADNFFCPSLKVLSRMLHLNENLAGVTLLAFGNAAPDLFTSIAGLQGEQREVYNDIMGSATFVALMVSSTIITVRPFTASSHNFLRDIFFLILDIVYMDFIVHTGNEVTLVESVVALSLYLCYIIVIILDQYLLLRAAKDLTMRVSTMFVSEQESLLLKHLQSEAQFQLLPRHSLRSPGQSDHRIPLNVDAPREENIGLFRQAWRTLTPYSKEDWRKRSWFRKGLLILSAPITFVVTLFVPIVDYEEPLNGWSKLLNSLQIVTLPPIIIYGFMNLATINGIPICLLICCATVPLCVSVLIMTSTNTPPLHHDYFSILGAIGSVFVVYACAQETIEILNVIGNVTHRSNSFLGCTLLAWGNSIGDLVSNTAMALHGYHKMGLAACLGGPLFNTLLAIGMIYTYRAATSEGYRFQTGPGTLGENSTTILLIGLFGLLISALGTNFHLRRSIGIFPMLLYVLYLSIALMSEFEVIHGYGSDHRLDVKAEPAV